jgi:parallel beta-helix repeat protein
VWVAGGDFNERITLVNHVWLYGGFAGNETAKADRNPLVTPTILDGQAGGSVVTIQDTGFRTCGIDGFTIRNGSAEKGGGIYCSHAAPVISSNAITANTAVKSGGGLYFEYSSAEVSGNTISGNSAAYGSGVYGEAPGLEYTSGSSVLDLTLADNTISSNTGAGVSCYRALISNNKIIGNTGNGIDTTALTANINVIGNTIANNGGYVSTAREVSSHCHPRIRSP